jgi:hypothetical protein
MGLGYLSNYCFGAFIEGAVYGDRGLEDSPQRAILVVLACNADVKEEVRNEAYDRLISMPNGGVGVALSIWRMREMDFIDITLAVSWMLRASTEKFIEKVSTVYPPDNVCARGVSTVCEMIDNAYAQADEKQLSLLHEQLTPRVVRNMGHSGTYRAPSIRTIPGARYSELMLAALQSKNEFAMANACSLLMEFDGKQGVRQGHLQVQSELRQCFSSKLVDELILLADGTGTVAQGATDVLAKYSQLFSV